jgi:hypothetical protein
MVRTPVLGVSLRDNNAQHAENLVVVKQLISELSNLPSTPEGT